MKKEFVNLDSAKDHGREYTSVIADIKKKGVCPFCPDQLKNFHKRPTIIDGKHWLVTDNMYPYEGAQWHILLIHKNHIEDIREISDDGWQELQKLYTDILNRRKITGGTLFMRFGDTKTTGASVSHLHAHIVSGDPATISSRKPVITRVA